MKQAACFTTVVVTVAAAIIQMIEQHNTFFE